MAVIKQTSEYSDMKASRIPCSCGRRWIAPGGVPLFLALVISCFLGVVQSAEGINLVFLSPTNGATGVCYDTPLYITFDVPPTLATAGSIRIYSQTNATTPVDTIDLSLGNLQARLFDGDPQLFRTYVVLITSNTAAIYPHSGVLTSNQTYYVNIDNGVFKDSMDTSFAGINDATTWKFTTKTGGPANPTNLVAAADGSGDFCTVQGAVDSIPNGNTNRTVINIRDGDYNELVDISARNNVLFRGQSRQGTIIGYANNANIATNGTTHARMAFKVNGDDIAIDNLTITNRTPKGGSQAEALMLESNIKRFIANNVSIGSFQDTILANTSGTQGCFYNSLVQGDTDFIWGGANLFFTNCEIKCLSTGSRITQPRTDPGSNGMSFVRCNLTRSPGVVSCQLARALGYLTANVAYINCLIDDHITGWSSDVNGRGAPLPGLRWWEYGNSNITATGSVTYNGHQIGQTNDDPRLIAAREATIWLYGWVPRLSPNITRPLTNQTAYAGFPARLSVEATGIPDPTYYQWRYFGTNLPGMTNAILTIENASSDNDGPYSIVVSNTAGRVTSSNATLTVVPPPAPPTIDTIGFIGGHPSFTISGSSSANFTVLVSTNLVDWEVLFTTNSPAPPFVWIDPNPTGPLRYYLVELSP